MFLSDEDQIRLKKSPLTGTSVNNNMYNSIFIIIKNYYCYSCYLEEAVSHPSIVNLRDVIVLSSDEEEQTNERKVEPSKKSLSLENVTWSVY